MKTLKVVALGTLFLTAIIAADEVSAVNNSVDSSFVATETADEKLFKKFEEGVLFGLSSDVRGVVESTLYNTISYKIVYPEFNSEKVVEAVNRIAIEGESHTLRYRAYLVLAYYKNQDQFISPEVLYSLLDNGNQDRVFLRIQEEIQSDQFTSRN